MPLPILSTETDRADYLAEQSYQDHCAGQSYEQSLADRFNAPTPQVFTHIVTLIKRSTGHEVSFAVETLSYRPVDVFREVANQRVLRGLKGYALFEMLDCNDPF